MRYVPIILLFGLLSGFARSANAEEAQQPSIIASAAPVADVEAAKNSCKPAGFTQLASGFAYTEDAEVLSTHAVSQTDLGLVCGSDAHSLSVDVLVTAGLSTNDGSFGHRRVQPYQDEVDLTIEREDTFRTPLGPIDMEVEAAYWAIADLRDMKDDIIALHAQAGRPFTVSGWTLEPYARVTAWVGVGSARENTYLVSGGLKFARPIRGRVSFEGNFGCSEDLSDRYLTTYAIFGPTYDLGNQWRIRAQVQIIHGFAPIEEPPIMGIIQISKGF